MTCLMKMRQNKLPISARFFWRDLPTQISLDRQLFGVFSRVADIGNFCSQATFWRDWSLGRIYIYIYIYIYIRRRGGRLPVPGRRRSRHDARRARQASSRRPAAAGCSRERGRERGRQTADCGLRGRKRERGMRERGRGERGRGREGGTLQGQDAQPLHGRSLSKQGNWYVMYIYIYIYTHYKYNTNIIIIIIDIHTRGRD